MSIFMLYKYFYLTLGSNFEDYKSISFTHLRVLMTLCYSILVSQVC